MSINASLTIIAICQLLGTILFLVLVGGIIYLVFSTKRMIDKKVDEIMRKVQPVIDQVNEVATLVKNTTENVSQKVDNIAEKTEFTVKKVTDSVNDISDRVDKAVRPEIVNAIGIAGVVAKVIQISQSLHTKKSNPEKKDSK